MIPHEKQFHFKDGTSAATLEELKKKIETISYDEFYGHVNDEKNDFANWVDGVLHEHELAERMRAVKSIVETVELLNEKLYPSETKRHEQELEQRHEPDLQAEIERKIFGDIEVEAPDATVEENVPDIAAPEPPVPHPAEQPHEPTSEPRTAEPTKEEAAAAAKAAAHVPITRVVEDKLEQRREEALRQTTKEFVFGLLIGIILGFVLGVIIRGVVG